ncbi:MAG: hypothetical protein WCE90_01390 [Candidatus Zixiibacteriota bacterium]
MSFSPDGERASDFAEDGIVDEEKWNQIHRKILFFMKDKNKHPGDIRELIKKTPWAPEGYWAYGLQQLTTVHIPTFTEAKKPENLQTACWSSAVVNIKKLVGGSQANEIELIEAINRHPDFIKEELEIIQPDIIVCCGVFHLIKDLFTGMEPKGPDGRIFRQGNVTWVDFIHPSFPNLRHDISYYALITLYQNYYRPWQREAGS